MRRALAGALALLALTLSPAAGAATPKTTLHAIEVQVMCVTCGIPLQVAESPAAEQERHYIQTLINRGYGVKRIKDQLVAEFGTAVLALPPDRGVNVLFYVLPIALALAAIALLVILLPRWRARGRRGPPSPPTAALSSADAARLESDLARYDG